MLRVSSVSFGNYSTSKINRKLPNTVNPQPSQVAYNTVPINYNNFAVARSLISFRGLENINESYFKLPADCHPDKYQIEAAENLQAGNDVLVTAPTGTGKTAIALYSISQNTKTGTEHMKELTDIIDKKMEEGGRTFYTTPLKALSNEKYRQLKKVYGEENVGLMTGDVKENSQAPIVVMTTEIYRNMVFGEKFKQKNEYSGNLDNLKTVVFDELHYLGDVDRGGIWEQSIILSDPKTQMLSLSATIGNKEDINEWMSNVKGKPQILVNVPPEERHVPLLFTNTTLDKIEPEKKGKKAKKVKAKKSQKPGQDVPLETQHYKTMVKKLKDADRLPAIFFVFSKRISNDLLKSFAEDGATLTTRKEREEIQATVDRYKKEGKYLGESLNMEALMKGYSIHNSGLLPAQKELIEELFQKPSKDEPPRLKVIIATETLAAGINMPARTTVISSTRKPTSSASADGDDRKRELTPNEFHQMAGRAGRRGIDTTGYVYTMPTSESQKNKFQTLVDAPPNDLKSNFNPDFSFVAGYYKMTQDDDVINTIMKKSLHAFDRDPNKSNEKSQEMMKVFQKQKNLLNDFGFIQKDNKLTEKGELLSLLNGYYQIPVMNAIYDKKLAGMNPVELAACVGSLANVGEKRDDDRAVKNNEEDGYFQHDDEAVTSFVADFDNSLEDYNEKREVETKVNENGETVSSYKKIEQNKNATKHLYAWADLNSKEGIPRDNWRKLYSGDLKKTIRDEGSLFKEVTQTVDLLKQMSKISEEASKVVHSDEDVKYYSDLKSTIEESIELLRKEPIVEEE